MGDHGELGMKFQLFDSELESQVLASAMSDPEIHREICGWPSELFGNPVTKQIHNAMCKLASRGAPADPILLVAEFKNGDRQMMTHYVSTLTSKPIVSSSTHLASFEDKLVEMAKVRSMYLAAENSLMLIREGHNSREISAAMEEYSNDATFSRNKGIEIGDAALTITERARTLIASGDAYAGISTGYPELDHCIGGLTNGHLILLAGFTNMGKSAFAIQMCHNALRHGNKVAYISMELTAGDIAERMIALSGKVSTDELRALGRLDETQLKTLDHVAEEMRSLPLVVMDRPTWSMNEIRAEARRLKRRDCKMLVIDLLGKVHVETKKHDSRARELEMVAVQAKSLAKELDIPILGCVQLNRQSVYDQQAELHHLKDSNGLAENADEVLILDRRDPKKSDRRIYVKIRKSRRGSNHADIPFVFDPKHQAFNYEVQAAI